MTDYLSRLKQPARYFMATDAEGHTAFYNEAVHGYRLRPVIGCETPEDIRQLPIVTVTWEPNPDCLIPEDAVLITDEQYAEHQEGE